RRSLGRAPGSAGQTFAVRGEGHTRHIPNRHVEGKEFLAGLRIPDLELFSIRMANCEAATTQNPLSAAATGQALAVGAKDHARDFARMPLQSSDFLARLGIPHLHRSVPISAGQAFAVRAEGNVADMVGVPFEVEEFLTSLGIPYLPSADQAFAVRAEGHTQ